MPVDDENRINDDMLARGKMTQGIYLLALIVIAAIGAYLLINFLGLTHPNIPGLPTPTVDTTLMNGTNNDTIGGLRYRWVYIREELDVPGNLEKVQELMRRAKADGYNGIVFSNLWSQNNLENLNSASPEYIKKLETLRNTADSFGLEFYPAILTVGYAGPILSSAPYLVEGLPVKNALYVVQNGQADLMADPAVSLPGGDFEMATDNTFYGWDSQSWPGTNTFADPYVKHGGLQSLRVETKGISRIYKTVDVSPYRQYHLSYWIKTEGVFDTTAMEPTITGVDDGRQLAYPGEIAGSTQDWTKVDIVFDSLDNRQVTISLGTWDWQGGTIWFDDASLDEVGLINIVRRAEYPLIVTGENGTVYSEGVDFKPVSDPLLGLFTPYHQAPVIQLTAGSRIKDGEHLRVSYYAAGVMFSGQVSISLTNPEARAVFKDRITGVNEVLRPQGFLFNYNEITVGNWEVRPVPMTEGEVIADSFKYNENIIRSLDPGLKVFVWNDMFDPYHNALEKFDLINGTCDGSYNGLDGSVTVVNWNFAENRTKSLAFFSNRGHPQILAGFYDGKAPPISQWLEEARGMNADVDGVMYTTWNSDYSGLEAFARDAWGGGSG